MVLRVSALEPASGNLLLLTLVCPHSGLRLVIRDSTESSVFIQAAVSAQIALFFITSFIQSVPSYCSSFDTCLLCRLPFHIPQVSLSGALSLCRRGSSDCTWSIHYFGRCVDKKYIFPFSFYVKVYYDPYQARAECFPITDQNIELLRGADISALIHALFLVHRHNSVCSLYMCVFVREVVCFSP